MKKIIPTIILSFSFINYCSENLVVNHHQTNEASLPDTSNISNEPFLFTENLNKSTQEINFSKNEFTLSAMYNDGTLLTKEENELIQDQIKIVEKAIQKKVEQGFFDGSLSTVILDIDKNNRVYFAHCACNNGELIGMPIYIN